MWFSFLVVSCRVEVEMFVRQLGKNKIQLE